MNTDNPLAAKRRDDATADARAITFYEVFHQELRSIQDRRTLFKDITRERCPSFDLPALKKTDKTEGDQKGLEHKLVFELQKQALNYDLTGLAISGGGIRSATFALGVLQAFAFTGLLRRFDYLSTVSGGGYIGSWLSVGIKRVGFDKMEERLLPARFRDKETGSADDPSIQHLRL
jgi:hypothetical protein